MRRGLRTLEAYLMFFAGICIIHYTSIEIQNLPTPFYLSAKRVCINIQE
jgi:hypothetical protein